MAEVCGIMRKPSDPRIPLLLLLLCGHYFAGTGQRGLDPDLDRAPSFPFWNDQRTGSIVWGVDSDYALCFVDQLEPLCRRAGDWPQEKEGWGLQPGPPPPDHRLLPSFPHAADTTGGTVPRVRSRARRPGQSVWGRRRVVGLGEM